MSEENNMSDHEVIDANKWRIFEIIDRHDPHGTRKLEDELREGLLSEFRALKPEDRTALKEWARGEVQRLEEPTGHPNISFARAAYEEGRLISAWPSVLKLLDEESDA